MDKLLSLSAETQSETKSSIFEALGLEVPDTALPSKYSDYETYYDYLSRLVVEETRYTIIEETRKCVEKAKEGESQKPIGVRIKITGTPDKKPFNECYTYQQLSSRNRNNLKAGSVIAVVPAGKEFIPENMTLGVIQYGSLHSRPRTYDCFVVEATVSSYNVDVKCFLLHCSTRPYAAKS